MTGRNFLDGAVLSVPPPLPPSSLRLPRTNLSHHAQAAEAPDIGALPAHVGAGQKGEMTLPLARVGGRKLMGKVGVRVQADVSQGE